MGWGGVSDGFPQALLPPPALHVSMTVTCQPKYLFTLIHATSHRVFVTGSYKRYQPSLAYHASRLTALQGPTVPTPCWEARRTFMAATAAAWSPAAVIAATAAAGSTGSGDTEQQQQQQRVTLLAVGCKAGAVQLWRHQLPQQYSSSSGSSDTAAGDTAAAAADSSDESVAAPQYLDSIAVARGAYVTSLAWAAVPAAAAAAAAAAAGDGSSKGWGVVPGYVARQSVGDVLLLAVGES